MHNANRCRAVSARWRAVLAGFVLTGMFAFAQQPVEPPTPALPDPDPIHLDQPVFPNIPEAPKDHQPIGIDGNPYSYPTNTTTGNTRPDQAASRGFDHGYTAGGDGSKIGKTGVTTILPFGTKGERAAIAFSHGDFVPPAGEKIQPELRLLAQQRAQMFNPASGSQQPAVYALILFNSRLSEEMKRQMEAAGIEFLSFYPYAAYQARIPVDALSRLEATEAVQWVGQPNAMQKLDPALVSYMQRSGTERVLLYINLFGPDPNNAASLRLQAAGITVLKYYPDLHYYYAEADSRAISNALTLDEVLYVEQVPVSTTAHTESQTSINADRIWGTSFDGRPTGGVQQKLGVMDSGMNTGHQDFSNLSGGMFGFNRTTEQNWFNDLHGHGTHVSGTFFGQGNAQARYRGFASGFQESNLQVYDLLHSKVFRSNNSSEGNSVGEGLEDMRGRGNNDIKRTIFNYSGGFAGTNLTGTDTQSRTVDLAFGEDILPVIAAGNEGSGAGTVRGPGVSKGALTVGNIYDDGQTTVDTMSPDSSRGPTGDSRFKPDVVAPGRAIDSTSNTSNNGYRFGWNGTSMATPHVAGLATTLKQRYNWPAWAIRAILMGTAINLGFPRNDQGLGKVDALLSHSAWNGGWETWYWSNGATGMTRYIDVNVPAGCTRLRVTMVYPDPPASAGAGIALVNDLDLYLQTGALTTDRFGQWSSLSARNNVEVIEVANPAAGTYRVKVYTYALNSGSSQNWAFNIHYTFGSQTPNVVLNLTAPAAVQPSANFTVRGTGLASSYVASGVFARLTVPSGGLTRNGLTYFRRAPNGGEESVYFEGTTGKNMGNIGHNLTRKFEWSMTSGGTEGTYPVRMDINSNNGGTSNVQQNVIVDGTAPASWGNFAPSGWATSMTPTCSIQVRDVLSGLNSSGLYYWYWTPGTGTQGPFNATGPANGTTALATMFANSVPFNRENGGTDCQVYFRAFDRAGNFSDSGWNIVKIDATPPGNWQNFAPAGVAFGPNQTCSVQVRDVLSGLAVSVLGWYQYSTDGGTSWSAWSTVTVPGSDGTTAFQTITVPNVPFNQASATLNKIRFAIRDVAGNWGYSSDYTVNTTNTFTLTDGSATYSVQNAFGAANREGVIGGLANFITSSGDQLFQDWWWYRVQGNNREYALSNLVEWSQISANQMRLVYLEPDDVGSNRMIRFELIYSLQSLGSNSARVNVVHRTINQTGFTRMVHLYPYFDFDLSGGGNLATLVNSRTIRQTGAGGNCLNVWSSILPSRWEIDAFANLRAKLGNAQADDLANGAPFGPGDATAAFQFTRNLTNGQAFGGTLVKALNAYPNPGDVNGDGCVNDTDLLEVLFNFGATGFGLAADLNCDGVVNDGDLLVVLFNFGAGC
ncbi:MAG: S8 family serine peptidase [Fimbriimonadia bacterium]|nr:S8 family serine peptidase [Fimbriimonadia bacterium]